MLERIQKIISAAGITSRRAAEQLILDGRVRVNGRVVTELGTKADASKDHIKVDGKLVNPRQPLSYIMLNKPAGYVTTLSDPEGRPTVQDLLKGVKIRVYPVGRLDYNTEGLLLLTNDGNFAHLITHPRHEFPKTYRAKIKGVLEDRQIGQLEQGVYLDDGRTAPAKLKKISREEANSWVDITIHEGRKRQVRRMFDRVGHSVIKLKRVKIGDLLLGDLPEGVFRYLTRDEVNALKEFAVSEHKMELSNPQPEAARRPGKDSRAGKQGLGPAGGAALQAKRRHRAGTKQGTDEIRGPGRRPSGDENRWSNHGQWIPGRGAGGRGPRRPLREEVGGPNRGQEFARPGAGKRSEFRETGHGGAAAKREGQMSWDRGAEKGPAFKPRRSKIRAKGVFGKTFGESPAYNPGTHRASGGTRGTDRKPRRSYERPDTGKPKAPGIGRKPHRPGR